MRLALVVREATRPGSIATYMESLLRDLGDARDACNKLPFDDALRDKIATELDRIEAAPPLERMLVTKPPVKRWAELVSRQKVPSIKTVRLRSPPCCASSTASPLGGQAKVLRTRVALP